jgi:NAD(P)H-nitrite reductase large subunit
MRRLVVVGNGNAARAFLRQIQRYRCNLSITVFSAEKPPHPAAWYRARGIDMRAGVSIVAIDRHARLALGDDGSRTTFDRLILATGLGQVPPVGVATRNGVIVNRSLETSDGHIYAIGDCAEPSNAGGESPASFSGSLERLARSLAARLVSEATGAGEPQKMQKYNLAAVRNLNAAPALRVLTA